MKDKLIAIGEALIDFMPDKTGCAFYEVTGFESSGLWCVAATC